MSEVKSTRVALRLLRLRLDEKMQGFLEDIDVVSQEGEHTRDEYFNVRFAARFGIDALLHEVLHHLNLQQAIEHPDAVTLAVTNMIEEVDREQNRRAHVQTATSTTTELS